MKKTSLVLAAAATCLIAGSSQAQTVGNLNTPVVKPLTIKLGAFFPSSSTQKDVAGSTQFAGGLDYAFTKSKADSPTLGSVYLDFQGGKKGGLHLYSYGLGGAVRTYLTPINTESDSPAVYAGLGLGVYVFHINNGVSTGTSTLFGGKVFGGVEFQDGLLVEASYRITPSRSGVDPNGIGIAVGKRF